MGVAAYAVAPKDRSSGYLKDILHRDLLEMQFRLEHRLLLDLDHASSLRSLRVISLRNDFVNLVGYFSVANC